MKPHLYKALWISIQTSSVPNKWLVTSKDDIIRYFPEILEGLGKFPGEPYHNNVDPSIPPKHLPARPVPVHQQAAFKQQLDDMIQAGVIVPVTEATPWINSYVIVESEDQKRQAKARYLPRSNPIEQGCNQRTLLTHRPQKTYITIFTRQNTSQSLISTRDIGKCPWMRKAHTSQLLTPHLASTTSPTCHSVSMYLVMHFRGKLDTIYNPLPNVIGIADDLIIWGNKEDGF